MKISIVIAVKGDNKNLRECIEKCLELNYDDFEVMVMPDENINLQYGPRVRVIPTGVVGPAKKRDISADKAKGDILAFLDDDAYPAKDWLKNAAVAFLDPDVAAVGGPAVTPADDGIFQNASGLVYSSWLVGGPHNRRYIPAPRCEVDDYPSCNLLIRKEAFDRAGRFNTEFWPGEDTVLCLKVVKDRKKKIIYDPGVLVYHHRRPLFGPHLRQIRSYALHRGYFVKRFPGTSLRGSYFLPSILVLAAALGAAASIVFPGFPGLYFLGALCYLSLVALSSFSAKGAGLKALVFLGIIATHFTYGIYFIGGLLVSRLREEGL